MELFVVGTSQSVAPVSLRERAHVDLDHLYGTFGKMLVERGTLEEAVPLSTCGRLELYAVAQDAERALQLLIRLMARKMGMPQEEVRGHAYALEGRTAVRHLLRVASGLDSVIHGEAQILGKVKEVLAFMDDPEFAGEIRQMKKAGRVDTFAALIEELA